MIRTTPHLAATFTAACLLGLLPACDDVSAPSSAAGDDAADNTVPTAELDEAGDSDEAGEAGESGESGGSGGSDESGSLEEPDSPLDPELEELAAPPDPQGVFADWVGGSGGTAYSIRCPYGMAAIGIAAAPNPAGSLVRQLAIVCGWESEIEVANPIPIGAQVVLASGYNNSGWQVAPTLHWRVIWDLSQFNPVPQLRYKAPSTSYHLCDPGYRLNQIHVHAGALVDRIFSRTCWWDGPGTGGPRGQIYTDTVGVGGWGGSFDASSCQSTSERFVDGFHFRSGALLDGFRLDCRE